MRSEVFEVQGRRTVVRQIGNMVQLNGNMVRLSRIVARLSGTVVQLSRNVVLINLPVKYGRMILSKMELILVRGMWKVVRRIGAEGRGY